LQRFVSSYNNNIDETMRKRQVRGYWLKVMKPTE
ncbi:hypothetical protein T12_16189, partial [Trichinella patagoniensis]